MSFALILVMVRRTRLEWAGVAMSVTVMSISALFYIIVGQWLFSKTLRWVPVSGFSEGFAMAAFLVLPVAIGVFTRLGGEALLYRSMFLEESEKDYVRTARAKGVSEMRVLFRHVLGNAMLPVITSTVVASERQSASSSRSIASVSASREPSESEFLRRMMLLMTPSSIMVQSLKRVSCSMGSTGPEYCQSS